MIQQISSPDNTQIKLAASLRLKKYRDESGLFLIEGLHLIEEALAADLTIEHLFVCQEHFSPGQFTSLMEQLRMTTAKVLSVPVAVFKKVAETESPQGVVAVVRKNCLDLPASTRASGSGGFPVWVILDAVQDPGNVGTIVRNADASGVAGLILTPGCADLYAGKTVRASMGSLFHIPTYTASVQHCLDFFIGQNVPIYISDIVSAKNYTELDLTVPCAVVFGNEGAGVGEAFRQHAAAAIRIPIIGKAESLNVASAAAVILFEAARQRGFSLS
jgi:TrmH family RNA methyltransferase